MNDKSKSTVTRLVDRVFPRMPDFYSLLNDQCDLLVEAMGAFIAYMEDASYERAHLIRVIEERGDEIKARNTDILNRAFATPMDREDIYNAIITLDMGINYAKTTTREMEALNLNPDKFMLDMVVEYKHAAEALRRGFQKLAKNPIDAEQDALTARKAERNIEKIYRCALTTLFDVDEIVSELDGGEKGSKAHAMFTVIEIFKRREIYRHLSNGADRMAHAADRLHDIIVKIS